MMGVVVGAALGWMPIIASALCGLVLSGVLLLTSLLTEVMSNNAVAVIATPIAVAAADELGLPGSAVVLAVLFGANTSYMTPIGYQTNLLVFSAGGYRFTNFFRVGIPLHPALAHAFDRIAHPLPLSGRQEPQPNKLRLRHMVGTDGAGNSNGVIGRKIVGGIDPQPVVALGLDPIHHGVRNPDEFIQVGGRQIENQSVRDSSCSLSNASTSNVVAATQIAGALCLLFKWASIQEKPAHHGGKFCCVSFASPIRAGRCRAESPGTGRAPANPGRSG